MNNANGEPVNVARDKILEIAIRALSDYVELIECSRGCKGGCSVRPAVTALTTLVGLRSARQVAEMEASRGLR